MGLMDLERGACWAGRVWGLGNDYVPVFTLGIAEVE